MIEIKFWNNANECILVYEMYAQLYADTLEEAFDFLDTMEAPHGAVEVTINGDTYPIIG